MTLSWSMNRFQVTVTKLEALVMSSWPSCTWNKRPKYVGSVSSAVVTSANSL